MTDLEASTVGEPPPPYMIFLLVFFFFITGLLGFLVCHLLKKKGYRCRTGEEEDDEECEQKLGPDKNDDEEEENQDTVEQILKCIIENEANMEAFKDMLGKQDICQHHDPRLLRKESLGGIPPHHHTVHSGAQLDHKSCTLCVQGRSKKARRLSRVPRTNKPRTPGERRESTVFAVGRFRVTHMDKKDQGSGDQLDQSEALDSEKGDEEDPQRKEGYNLQSMFKDVKTETTNGVVATAAKRKKSLVLFSLRRGSDPVGVKVSLSQPVVEEEPLFNDPLKTAPVQTSSPVKALSSQPSMGSATPDDTEMAPTRVTFIVSPIEAPEPVSPNTSPAGVSPLTPPVQESPITTPVQVTPMTPEIFPLTPGSPTNLAPSPLNVSPATSPLQAHPTPTLVQASPTPVQASHTPVQASPTPVQASHTPTTVQSSTTPTPVQASPTPVQASPTPVQASPTHVQASPTPVQASHTPVQTSHTPTPVQASPTTAPLNLSPALSSRMVSPSPTSLNLSPSLSSRKVSSNTTPLNLSPTLTPMQVSPALSSRKVSSNTTPLNLSPTLTPMQVSPALSSRKVSSNTTPLNLSPTLTPMQVSPALSSRKVSSNTTPLNLSPTPTPMQVSPALSSRKVSPVLSSRNVSPALSSRKVSPASLMVSPIAPHSILSNTTTLVKVEQTSPSSSPFTTSATATMKGPEHKADSLARFKADKVSPTVATVKISPTVDHMNVSATMTPIKVCPSSGSPLENKLEVGSVAIVNASPDSQREVSVVYMADVVKGEKEDPAVAQSPPEEEKEDEVEMEDIKNCRVSQEEEGMSLKEKRRSVHSQHKW
ncbi:mucin-2-like [Oncorhynchus masou masou]|uniref:mucin-2-like n=1 Tax=Oncorhynchus masou masou TaxID=90313 RepID=UPI003183EE18